MWDNGLAGEIQFDIGVEHPIMYFVSLLLEVFEIVLNLILVESGGGGRIKWD